MKTSVLLLTSLMACLAFALCYAQEIPPYKNPRTPIEERVKDLLGRMSLEEKIDLLAGTGFETKPNARLGIPPLNMTDGPLGVRWGKSTAFPASACLAATWNPLLVEKAGAAIAREVRAKGRHMLLAPCINIERVPLGGRSFESFGEDPYLTSQMTAAYVRGVQSQKVIATVKHFAANNQEWDRFSVSANVDERTLREIYLPGFRAGVKEGGAWSVMSAYNKLNGMFCSENPWLLTEVLKKEWGFQGFVVSDWGATHSTAASANAGLDLEMPTGVFFHAPLLDAVRKGLVQESTVNDKVIRLLRAMFWAGIFDDPLKFDDAVPGSTAQREVARTVASEGVVLLRNESALLPLDLRAVKSIAVIGPNAPAARVGGGGSARVEPTAAASPLEVLVGRVGGAVRLAYARGLFSEEDFATIGPSALRSGSGGTGLKAEYFNNPDCKGSPVLVRVDPQIAFDWKQEAPSAAVPRDKFSVRWTGFLLPPADGRYDISVQTDDGVRLSIDNRMLMDDWRPHGVRTRTISMTMKAGRQYPIRMEYFDQEGSASARLSWRNDADLPIAEAAEAARSADVAVVFAGLDDQIESEGYDRESLELPTAQNDLIEAVLRANRNTIVVLNAGAPVLMTRWATRVPAVLLAWYPGQEGAQAVVDVLLGEANPSGKLPVTFPKRWEDSPAFGNYPGVGETVNYKEGILVGYRHFDTKNLDVAFPFGFGLSYSTFVYRNLRIAPGGPAGGTAAHVTLEIENTSRREGAEVVQLYLRDVECSVPRPAKELKGFVKTLLRAGQKTDVTFEVPRDALAFFHPTTKQWTVEPGKFEVLVGSSSRDIRLKGEFTAP
jgi:beta-glucosidase